MKIRIDFVTNSSSSSFVAVNLGKGILAQYLSDNGMEGLFDQIEMAYAECEEILAAELDKSFAQSVINILKKVSEDIEYSGIGECVEVDTDQIDQIIKFITKNKSIIDSEAEGNIELKAGNGEDGFAYVQRLTYKKHHGQLVKWPCTDGWNYQEGGGYEKIQEFNTRMFNGEVAELAGLAYDAIWDLIWDDKELETAIEKTGIIEDFDVEQPKKGSKVDIEKDLSLEDIDPVNVGWISGALFVFTGLSENDESIATDIIEDNDGVIKSSVVLKTNYVIYNPYYDHETTKLQKARELIGKGKPIQLLTVSEFCKKLITSENGTVLPKPEKKEVSVPTTLKECKKIFECTTDGEVVEIRGIKKSTAEVIIPGIIDGMPVYVGQGAFNKNKKLEKVVFSNGVTAIMADTFNDCKLLKEVVFADSIRTIGSGVFRRTPWIQTQGDFLIINNILVTYLGEETNVVIPDGVSHINQYAFQSSWKLQSVVIPDSVYSIGGSAFSLCSKLKDITFPDHEIEFETNESAFGSGDDPFSGTAWENSYQDWVVFRGVLLGCADNYYYRHLMNADSFAIPDTVKVIGSNPFMTGIREWKNIKKVELPEGLEIIGPAAFRGFSSLEEIEIPSTVVKIGARAFEGCTSLKCINFPDGLKEIGNSAFSGMSGWGDTPATTPAIEEVILPDSVEKIGTRAFAYCESLKKLRLPKNLDVIPDAMVHTCKNLCEVEMPEECRIIEDDAFESCEKLAEIKMPAGMESMGRRVFYGCINLKGIDLPKTIRNFGWATFKRCDAITNVTIPDGVTELPEELFLHCDVVESIRVPASVTQIGGRVFEECPKLTVTVIAGSAAEKYVKDNKIPYITE